MSKPRPLRRFLKRYLAPLVGVVALAFAAYVYLRRPAQPTYHLRMTAGSTLDTRHRLGLLLKSELAAFGFQLELEGTAGSETALERVNRHDLDLALVQGGLQRADFGNVREV